MLLPIFSLSTTRRIPMFNRFFLKLKWPVNPNRLFMFLLAFLAIAPTAKAQDLLLAPYRVVFDGSTRSQEIALINRGTKPGLYRIEFVNMVLNDKQELVESDSTDKGEKSAKNMVRASVRQVELDAGETQMIRIALRKPVDLLVGEYRTHLKVTSLPKVEAPRVDELKPNEVSVKLMPAFGMTIPVLVRQGRPPATATATKATIRNIDEDGSGQLDIDIKREGDRSLFVDIDVATAPAKGKGAWVMTARGVSIYAPYDSRLFSFQATKEQINMIKNNRLRVLVTEIDANGKQIAKPSEAVF
jgi:P pilus assembly chaperone PapD